MLEFKDLKKQYNMLKNEIDEAIHSVICETNFISGKPIKELEKKLAEYAGTRFCVGCGNGTDALSLALMVWGIGSGDAVFVPDFTFFASGEVVAYSGATPIFVDVEEETYNIDCEKLEKAIVRILEEGKLCPKVILAVGWSAGIRRNVKEKENLLAGRYFNNKFFPGETIGVLW